MACVGCQERRKAIKAMAEKVGTIVFGGRRRTLARFSEDRGEKSDQAGLDTQAAAAAIVAVDRADAEAGTAGDPAAALAPNGGG